MNYGKLSKDEEGALEASNQEAEEQIDNVNKSQQPLEPPKERRSSSRLQVTIILISPSSSLPLFVQASPMATTVLELLSPWPPPDDKMKRKDSFPFNGGIFGPKLNRKTTQVFRTIHCPGRPCRGVPRLLTRDRLEYKQTFG